MHAGSRLLRLSKCYLFTRSYLFNSLSMCAITDHTVLSGEPRSRTPLFVREMRCSEAAKRSFRRTVQCRQVKMSSARSADAAAGRYRCAGPAVCVERVV